MGIGDAVVVGLFCITVVFIVLVALWGAVAGFSWLLQRVEGVIGDSGKEAGR
jgi:hypothetical protein